MNNPVCLGELELPRFVLEGYEYLGEDEQWHIKDDAPEWAKKEFKEFYAKLRSEPIENRIVVQG